MVLDLFSDRFLHRFLYELGFGGGCGSGGKVVHLELLSDRFLCQVGTVPARAPRGARALLLYLYKEYSINLHVIILVEFKVC